MTRRLALVLLGIVALLCTGTLLSACGDPGTTLARQACTYVDRSLELWKHSDHASSTTEARTDQLRAYADLRDALPIAASANSANGQWNALMTTISESARVPEQYLVTALQAQCALAQSPNPGNAPIVPLTVPGGGSGSSSTTSSTTTTSTARSTGG